MQAAAPPLRQIIELAFNRGELSSVDEHIAAGSVVHLPAWGMPPSRMGLKLFITTLRTALPDLECTIQDEILESGRLAAHWMMRGTHQGPFLGSPPSGKPVEVQGTLFARAQENLIVEIWVQMDQFGMLQQLGIVPPLGGGI